MKAYKFTAFAVALCGAMLFAACGEGKTKNYKDDVKETDKDFTDYYTPDLQENAYDYKFNFLPEKDGVGKGQGYVGDTMPYYENGTYYVYYLKDRGDSYNHSVYLATTTDFVHWNEEQEPVLESSTVFGEQDVMIGTGSVVKVKEKYYFFYTGHNENNEYHEKIMVAEGTSPASFKKRTGWEIVPDADLGKNDFRDPQAYYDEATNTITLTVTAQKNGVASVLAYTLKGDLSDPTRGNFLYTRDPAVITGSDVWNLECSDTFKIGSKWYLTFSAQNGTMWYTSSDEQYGTYTDPKPLDGHLFYAAKHASDGENTYLIGWSRSSESPTDTSAAGILKNSWAGNMAVQKVVSDGAGGIRLAPADAFTKNTEERVLVSGSSVSLKNGDYTEAFRCFERYMVTGKFTYGGTGTFGFAFDFDEDVGKEKYKTVVLSGNSIALKYDLGKTGITEIAVSLEADKAYGFTYIQEGSVGMLYVEGQTAFTVRLYGVSGKNVRLFAEGGSASFTDLKQYTYTY